MASPLTVGRRTAPVGMRATDSRRSVPGHGPLAPADCDRVDNRQATWAGGGRMARLRPVERRFERFMRNPLSVRAAMAVIVTATVTSVLIGGVVISLVDS